MANVTRKIKGITIEFGADATKLLQTFSEIEHKARKLSSINKDINKLLRVDPKNTQLLKMKQEELTKAINNTIEKTKSLNEIMAQMKADGVDEASDEYRALQRELIDTKQELGKLEGQLDSVNKKLNTKSQFLQETGDKMIKFGDKAQEVGKKISDFGNKYTLFVSTPVALFGKKSFDDMVQFEQGLAGVAKTSKFTDSELAKFGDQVRELSKTIPQGTDEILRIAETAGQLGIADENILAFSEEMLKMGQATNMGANEAGNALARFANIMGTSEDKFGNMGSAIVALGNNLETTESEITDLALRLAGTSKQVGMSESSVFGLAGAMSSLGINAESGGTSMSRVMQKVNTAVIAGGEEVEKFAKIAESTYDSAEEFSKAWKDKPEEALIALIKGLDEVSQSGGDTVSVMKELGITNAREVDSVLRLSSNTELLSEAIAMSNEEYEKNTALTIEAEKRNETLGSRIEVLKNRFKDLMLQIGERLVPYAEKFMESIQGWIEKFDRLDDGTKDFIVKAGLAVVALGPLLSIVGKLTGGFGSLVKGGGHVLKWAGDLGSKIAGSGGLTQALGSGAGGLGGTLTSLTGGGGGLATFGAKLASLAGPAGVAVLATGAIAGLAYTGVKAFKHLSSESIPQMNLFGEGVSDTTAKAVTDFLKLEEDASNSLKQLSWSGDTVTAEMADSISTNFATMKETILTNLETQHTESNATLQKMFEDSRTFSQAEKEALLLELEERKNAQVTSITEGEARIKEIMELASTEKRALTQEETTEINAIREEMKNTGIRVLTESEAEHKVIMQRMADQGANISAQGASEIVKSSLDQKNKTIENANKEYEERIRVAEEIRAQGGAKANETANKIIEEAKRQKDDTIKHAEEMHKQVVDKAKTQAKEHVDSVDWETGEVLSRWDKLRIKGGKVWDSLKTGFFGVSNVWKGFTGDISTGSDEVKKDFDALDKNVDSNFKSIKSDVDAGASKIESAMGRVRKSANFSWSIPKPKLPKISVAKATGILGVPYPKFSVSWNRMGGIFKQPTVIPTLAGMQGFAEPSTGGEAILPLNKLPSLIAEAMDMTKQQQQTIVNYFVLEGKVIAEQITPIVDQNLSRNASRVNYAGGF